MQNRLNYLVLLTAIAVVPSMASSQDLKAELSKPAVACAQPQGDQPFEQIQLDNGSTLQFFYDAEGGVAVSEQGRAGEAAILNHPELQGGTITDLYWAVTRDERPVPDFLMKNHRLMAEQPWAGLGKGRQRGWLLDYPPQPDLSKADECTTGVQEFVCNTSPSSYPSGPGCFNNSYGEYSWTNGGGAVRRYRTGVCSYGTYDATIQWHYNGPSSCEYFRPLSFLHNGRFTNHYYFYWWGGPSDAYPRSYDNTVTHVSGSPFDWGVRFNIHSSSSCTL